ncbi:putative transcription factor interactor and regulator CCHC(Zn) family [Helianthus annuus]|nr:putative transcription factor interactor and regulator CCHC(Zn) family [Helianthus annuus]KAJ0562606.1 putative transcription factor interactor and regulator CCHC(Zn) family [Helianthus annuus]KAJ0727981.1 putative transcription factor interactor and regulator CCHC(Zn) family [Helianthus annuus]
MVYGTCNRCGIGHIPSHCPNKGHATTRGQSPSANFSDVRSQASSSYRPDTGATNHVASDLSSFDYSKPYLGRDNLHVCDGQVYTHYPPHESQQ